MPGHPKFFQLLEKMKEIHLAKNNDYAEDNDPLSNLKMCTQLNVPAYIGVLIRCSDKYARLIQLSKKEARVKDESFQDTLLDLANYCLLCYILYDEEVLQSKIKYQKVEIHP